MSSPSHDDINMMAVKEENVCDIDEYQSIFQKLKKLHDIAKTNDDQSGSTSTDKNKLAPKRKPDLDLDGLSDDSALNSSNKTKRRRFSDSQDYPESGDFDVRDYRPTMKKMYVISISNLPGEWNYDKIKQYVTDECGVNVLKMMDSRTDRSDYQLRLRFNNEEHYQSIYNKLKRKEMEGRLKVEVDEEDDAESNDSVDTFIIGKRKIKSEGSLWTPDLEESSSAELFGLKQEFLKSLNISPPLVKWIHVTNFRCDKSELRDVFEMAGRVITCVVVNTINKYAKIMYSHPLEAVQAISMLNGQIFYGQSLKVTLDPFAENALPLPKGLQNYGPGLGEMGKPLRDVVHEFERYSKGKPSNINRALFSITHIEPYEPTKSIETSSLSSVALGQFGPIGPKRSDTSYRVNPFASQAGPSNYCPRPQSSGPMYSGNRRAITPPITGRRIGPTLAPLSRTWSGPMSGPMPGPIADPNIRLQQSQLPNRGPVPNLQMPPNSNFQRPQGPIQRPPNFSMLQGPNQTGPNYQGPIVNQHGHNVQGPNPGPVGLNNQIPMNRPNFPNPPRGPSFPGPGPNYQGPHQGPNLGPNQGPNQAPIGPNIQHSPNFPNQGVRFQAPGQYPPNRFQETNAFNQRGPVNNVCGPPGPRMGLNNPIDPRHCPPSGSNGQEKSIMVLRSKDPVSLQITNLPPTVTFSSLCGKLSTVGQVISLQFTTPGSALVKFGNPSEAERCFNYYSPARFAHELAN